VLPYLFLTLPCPLLLELALYVWILHQQKKYGEALAVIEDENWGKKLFEVESLRLVQVAQCHTLLNNPTLASRTYRDLLLNHKYDTIGFRLLRIDSTQLNST